MLLRLRTVPCLCTAAILSLSAASVASATSGSNHSDTLPKPPRPHPIDVPSPGPAKPPVRPPAKPEPDAPAAPVPGKPDTHPPASPPADVDPPGAQPVTPAGPASSDRAAVSAHAGRFRNYVAQGRVRFQNDVRDRAQIDALCLTGTYPWSSAQASALSAVTTADTPKLDSLSGDPPILHRDQEPATHSGHSAPDGEGDASEHATSRQQDRTPAAVPTTSPPAELFLMLNSLAAHSTGERPLTITSLLRPPFRTAKYTQQSPTNPHALGIAVDIAAFDGHSIMNSNPEDEVQACLALLNSLCPGRYRMGLPRAPERAMLFQLQLTGEDEADGPLDAASRGSLPYRGGRRTQGIGDPPSDGNPGQTDRLAPSEWPFFPAPRKAVDGQGRTVTQFANERYAPEQFITDPRIRQALADARRRGVDVFALFPDGVNHIHVDVKQKP